METIPQSGNEPQMSFSGRRPNVPEEMPLKSATSYNNRPYSPDNLRRVKTDVQNSPSFNTSGPNTPNVRFSPDTGSMKDNISEISGPIAQAHPASPIMAFVEPFLGNTWFNYGLIICMVVLTYLMTKLGLGIVTCLGLAYIVAQIYKLSWKTTYFKAKQDFKDSVNAPELDSDYEGALWVNQFLNRFWFEFENYLTKTIVDSVEPIITPYLPAFVPWVKFTTFTLGTKAPIIESIKGFKRIETDLVLMDAEISFTPYSEEILNEDKTNLKIVVTARIQFGGYHIDIPVHVDNVHLHAFARIKLRFMNEFPHIKMVETSLISAPRYDYSVKLFSDRFGYDLTHIPYLQTFIKKQVNSILSPMMFAPNKFILDLEAIMSGGVEANFPIGVLQVYVDSARGLKNTELIGVPDPFVSLNIEGRNEIGRTQVVWNNLNPTWGESFTILVHSLSETLNFKVMNQNVAKESKMGTAEFNMSTLLTSPRQDLVAKVLRHSKTVGELSFRVNYFPTAEPIKNEDGTEQTIESDSAIVRFHLRQVEGMKKGGSIINLSKNQAQLILDINGKVVHKSPYKTIASNIVYEDTYEMFIESLKKTNVKVTLRLSDRSIIGRYSTTLSELMASVSENKEWFKFEAQGSNESISVKLDARFKHVIVDPNAIQGVLPPIGFVRVDVIEAKGLKGGELISKPEPYCQVVYSNKLVGKTRYLDNTTKPVWNDVYYVPVHGEKDSISFEVMHYNSVQKDKLLGKASVSIKDLLGPKWEFKEGYQHGEPHQEWYPLHIKEDKERGSVHLCLQYFSLHPQCLSDTKQVEKVLDQAKDVPTTEAKTQEPKEAEEVKEDKERQDSPTEPSPLDSVKPDELQKVQEEVENQFKLTDYNSGVLRIIIHEVKGLGSAKTNLHAVVLLNNNERVPVHKTTSKRGSDPVFEDTCQTFIKEVDIDRISVSIRSTKEGGQGKEQELAKWTGSVKDIVENLSEESRTFNFSGNTLGDVRLSFKFDACDYTISPSESGRNMGILQVTVVNAENLIAADRSGTSDPYVTFTLNGEKVFKSETRKKNLNPEFNESFAVPIENRISSKFVMEVFDWDQLGKHDSLGSAQLDLSLLDVETPFDVPVELENVKSGVVNLRMFFAPQYVLEDDEKHGLPGLILDSGAQFASGIAKGGAKFAARSLTGGASLAKGTGKLAGSAITGGGKLAIGGAKTVLSAPINVAKGGAGLVGSLFGKKNKDNNESDRESRASESSARRSSLLSPKGNQPVHIADSHTETINSETPTLINNNQAANQPSLTLSPPQTNNELGVPMETQTSTNSNISDDFSSPGSLKLSIFEAEDLMVADSKNSHSDPYIKLYINRKNVYKTKVMKKTRNPQWNEVYIIPNYIISEPISIEFQIKSYALLGDRPDLGNYTLNTGEFISQSNTSQDFWTENGLGDGQSGRLHLKLEFIPNGVYLSPTLARNSSSNLSETSVNLHDSETSKSSKLFGKLKKGFGSIKN